jgi:hypothetical protein
MKTIYIIVEDTTNSIKSFSDKQFTLITGIETTVSNEIYDDLLENGVGLYFYENGVVVRKNEVLEQKKLERNLEKFRNYRALMFSKYDILRICIITGEIEGQLTEEEKQWRLDLLNFTEQITPETSPEDYPQVPLRLQNL